MKREGNPVRKWKGLLTDETPLARNVVFAFLFIISIGMTFTQYGFVGIGPEGEYLGYLLGLLCPITLCALLLGKGRGFLFGLASGALLFLHSRFMPLDLYEFYFVSILNSFVLYSFLGFLLGLFSSIALRKDPKHRIPRFFVIALATSVIASVAFIFNAIVDFVFATAQNVVMGAGTAEDAIPREYLNAIASMGGIDTQILCDMLVIFVTAALCNRVVRSYYEGRNYVDVRTVFRTRLIAALFMVFVIVQASSFTVITKSAEAAASSHMEDEALFVGTLVEQNYTYLNDIVSAPGFDDISEELKEVLTTYDPSEKIVDGYDNSDGTIVVYQGDYVMYSDSPLYLPGSTMEDSFGVQDTTDIEEMTKTGEMRTMIYGMRSLDELLGDKTSGNLDVAGELGYMRAIKIDDFTVTMAMPASAVFANRAVTMRWATLLAFALTAAASFAAAKILGTVVAKPIERANVSLAKIMSGDLDELVGEVGTVEFATLSAGINATVDALKGLIGEAERRMESDLATAKAIQESALPRTFPPFPEIDAFDIYASMDAAKDVGGDFYDFFLIDDHTLGFLVADVSGKGIPGALFMMAAKAEIENYLATGMPPSEAIASANKRLCANNDAGMFVTVWAAILDFVTGELTYVNAGHNFPLLRHGRNGSWEWLKKKCGLFLGTFETAKYRQETIALEQGDELLLYTDGVNEAFSSDEEEFGNDRLEAFLMRHTELGPKLLVKRLRAEVATWATGAEQSDDITILALEYGATPEASESLTLSAELGSLSDAMALVSDELERRLCPLGVQNKVEVALEELFVNVCHYAYEGQETPGEVTVSYRFQGSPRSITVELRDRGVPFDPVSREDPTKPASVQEARIGGLGILMVRRSMDSFSYERVDDENVVRFSKGW